MLIEKRNKNYIQGPQKIIYMTFCGIQSLKIKKITSFKRELFLIKFYLNSCMCMKIVDKMQCYTKVFKCTSIYNKNKISSSSNHSFKYIQ